MTFNQIPIGTFFKIKKHTACAVLKKISETNVCNYQFFQRGADGGFPIPTMYGLEVEIYLEIGQRFIKAPDVEKEDL